MSSFFHFLRAFRIVIIFSRKGLLSKISKSSLIPQRALFFINILNFFVGKEVPDSEIGSTIVDTLKVLGPAFVKLGQALATRPDIIGVQLANELAQLHDNMEPFSYEKIVKSIKTETGKDIGQLFKSFNKTPIAAASISQVHKAKTFENDIVAVKILRPGVEKAIFSDLRFFKWCAKFLSSLDREISFLRLSEAVDIFEALTKNEMDLRLEAAAADELSNNFAKDERFVVPDVFWSLTSKRMLVTTWIDGIKINDLDALKTGGHKIDVITKNSAEAFFLQVFRDGFFHADMHPGNVFINSEGVIIPVDFGIMGRLHVSDRIFLAQLLKAILDRNFLKVAQLHFDKGILPSNTSIESFSQEIRALSIPLLDKKIGQISLGNLLGELFSLASKWKLNIQPQFLLLQKTIVMAEGIGRQLSPETDMWVMSKPLVNEWLSSTDLKKKFSQEVFSNIKMISKKLPEIIHKFDATLDYQSNKDQKKFSKTIIVLTFLYLSTITYLIFK